MGLCEHCEKQEAVLEMIDDDSPTGVAMVCKECYLRDGLPPLDEKPPAPLAPGAIPPRGD